MCIVHAKEQRFSGTLRSFSHLGATIWHEQPNHIKRLDIIQFKNEIRNLNTVENMYLLERALVFYFTCHIPFLLAMVLQLFEFFH